MKKGTKVVLNSGGPRMTIQSIKRDTARCMWFLDGHSMEDYFHVKTLTKIK